MNLTTCEKVCKECPFAKTSIKGWLGGLSVDETLDAQQFEQLFSCHLHRESDPMINLNKIMRGEQPVCRGFMISAIISCKSFGQNIATGADLKKLANSIVITDEEKALILKRWEFREHHTI